MKDDTFCVKYNDILLNRGGVFSTSEREPGNVNPNKTERAPFTGPRCFSEDEAHKAMTPNHTFWCSSDDSGPVCPMSWSMDRHHHYYMMETHIRDAPDLVKTWMTLIHLIDEECTLPWSWDSSPHVKNGFVFRKEKFAQNMAWRGSWMGFA